MAFRYEVPIADGRVIGFDSENQLTQEQGAEIANYLAHQADQERAQLEATASEWRGPLGFLQDTGLSLGKGLAGLVGTAGDLATLFGAEEGGKDLADAMANIQANLQEAKTEKTKAQEQMFAETEGFWDTLGYLASNPMYTADLLVEQVPQLFPIAKAGQGARALAQTVLKKEAGKAVERAGITGALGAGGAMQGADIGMQTYDTTYQQLVDQGVSEEEAAKQALSEARADAAQAAVVSVGAGALVPGGTAVERALLGKLYKAPSKLEGAVRDAGIAATQGRLARTKGAAKGFLGEATQEGVEEGGGALISGLTAAEYDPTIDPFANVARQAAIGAALGGPFGGVAGAVSANRQIQAEAQQRILEQAQELERQAVERAAAPQPTTGQVDMFPELIPAEPTAVERERATRAEARARIAAEQERRAVDEARAAEAAAQQELPLGAPAQPVRVTQQAVLDAAGIEYTTMPNGQIRPKKTLSKPQQQALRELSGLDLTDPRQRARADAIVGRISRSDAKWATNLTAGFTTLMEESQPAATRVADEQAEIAQQEADAARAAQARTEATEIRREDEQAAIQRAFEDAIQREEDSRRRVEAQAEQVRETATGTIPLTDAWKQVARRQLAQNQEQARMREQGLDQMAEEEAANFELDMQYVDERVPEAPPATKAISAIYAQQYTEAQDVGDQQLIDAVDAEAKSVLGGRTWGTVKGGLTKGRRTQQQALIAEARGEAAPTQPDLFRDVVAERIAQREAPSEVTEGREAVRGVPRGRPEAAVEQPAAEPRVEVAREQPEPEPAERAATPEAAGVARRGEPAVRDTGRARREPAALEEPAREREVAPAVAEAEAVAEEPVAEPRRERAPEAAREPVREVPPVRPQVAPAAEVVEAPPAAEVAEEVTTEMPASLVPLQRAINSPTESNVGEALGAAQAEGYFSGPEVTAFEKNMRQKGVVGRMQVMHIIASRISDAAYFSNNPEMVETMYAEINAATARAQQERKQILEDVPEVTESMTLEEVKAAIRRAGQEYDAEQVKIAAELDKRYADEDGKPMFSRMAFNGGQQQSTVAELKRYGQKVISRIKSVAPVEIVQSVDNLPEDIGATPLTRGVYHQGKVYIVADNTSVFDFDTVLTHEVVGHLGLEQMLGKGAFNGLINQVNQLKGTNEQVKRVLEDIKRAYTNVQGVYELSPEQEAREILAHIAQAKTEYLTDSKIRRLWNNLKLKVKEWLVSRGMLEPSDLMLDRLIHDAALHVQGGKSATRAGFHFLNSEYQSQVLMQRAWQHGYRGYDLKEAGLYMREILSGERQVPVKETAEIEEIALDDDYLDTPAFSRTAAEPAGDPRYAEYKFRPEPKKTFRERFQAVRGLRLFDTFRVNFVDTAATLEDKIMGAYNNAVTKDGVLNPMVSYVQALRSEGLAAMVMRRGTLELSESGLFKGVKKDGVPSLADVYEVVQKLGDRIGRSEARGVINAAWIAQREDQILKNNEKLQKEADALRAKGKAKEAQKREDKIVDLYPGMKEADIQKEEARIAKDLKLFDEIPEIKQAYDMFVTYKNGLIQTGIDTGLYDKETAEGWMENFGYVPFYRILEDAETAGPQQYFNGMMRLPTMKALKGSTKEINDVLDNIEKLSVSLVNSIVRNHAAKEMVRGLNEAGGVETDVNRPMTDIKQVPEKQRDRVVSYKAEGKDQYFLVKDPLDAFAWRGIDRTMPGKFVFGSNAADWLRKGITLTPQFIFSQIQQDSFRAFAFGGLKNGAKAGVNVGKEFLKIRRDLSKEGNFGAESLNEFGIIGMYDISPQRSREQIEAIFKGNQQLSFLEKTMLWAERNAEASDLAQRKAVFDQTMAETNNEAMAFWRASEVINFSRRGAHPAATVLRQLIPFQNAYMQGMNVLAKSMFGRGLSQEERMKAAQIFWAAGMKLAVLSVLYAALMADDDEYAKQPAHLRSRFFLFPTGDGNPPIKLAMPADLGFMFKAIPEMLVMQHLRDDFDFEKSKTELTGALATAILGPNMIPQILKPAVEVYFNKSFFTDSPIVSMGEEQLDVSQQYRDSTSQLARLFSSIGISPLKADHMIKGMFGTIGGDMLTTMDIVTEQALGVEKTQRELADYPLAKALFARTKGTGFKQDFYALREDVRGAVATMNKMIERGDIEGAREYVEENRQLIALRKQLNAVDNTIKKSNQRIKQIQANPNMGSEEKRERVDREKDLQARLAGQIARMRQYAYD